MMYTKGALSAIKEKDEGVKCGYEAGNGLDGGVE